MSRKRKEKEKQTSIVTTLHCDNPERNPIKIKKEIISKLLHFSFRMAQFATNI